MSDDNRKSTASTFPIVGTLTAVGLGLGAAFAIGAILDYHSEALCSEDSYSKVVEEIDDIVVSGVQVSLYTRPADLGASNCLNLPSAQTNTSSSDETRRHWALVFHFPNSGRYITYEATNEKSRVTWQCSQLPPGEVKGYILCRNIAECRTSPKRLLELAKRVPINDLRYNCTFRNCQDWIKLFAKEIGGEVWRYIGSNIKTFYDENPGMAFLAGCGNSFGQLLDGHK